MCVCVYVCIVSMNVYVHNMSIVVYTEVMSCLVHVLSIILLCTRNAHTCSEHIPQIVNTIRGTHEYKDNNR